MKNGGLVKTIKFKNEKYIGDPINAVKVFNEKEVDELILLDISESRHQNGPDFGLINDISSEAFVPFSYGGGINNIEQVKKIFSIGAEKVILNSVSFKNLQFIEKVATLAGSSGTIASIDVMKTWRGKYFVFSNSGRNNENKDPVKFSIELEKCGAGEIFINSINKDGTMSGYDTELINAISSAVSIPVIAVGGGENLQDLRKAYEAGASAISASSMFLFSGSTKGILITYPSRKKLIEIFGDNFN